MRRGCRRREAPRWLCGALPSFCGRQRTQESWDRRLWPLRPLSMALFGLSLFLTTAFFGQDHARQAQC